MQKQHVMGATVLMTTLAAAALIAECALNAADSSSSTKAARFAAKPLRDNVRKFMRAKLENENDVMEGLMTEDFDQIKLGASRMVQMSKQTHWQQFQTPVYTQDTADFVDVAEQLAIAAEKKDLDTASLHFVKLTLKCVNCHKHVRSKKVARNEFDRTVAEMAPRSARKNSKKPPAFSSSR
jgi:hypothetical protein